MSFGRPFKIFYTVTVLFANKDTRILPSTLFLVMMALEVIEWAKVY